MQQLHHDSAEKVSGQTRLAGSQTPPDGSFRPNVIFVMVDDAGMAQFAAYDEENRWPENYVYARMEWLGKLADRGIRYTQCRVAARCTPTRACMITGRHAHVSPTHEGNGMGDIQVSPAPFSGLNPDHWPYPRTATAAKTTYAMAHFGKFHLSAADATFEPDPRATVDQGHFPEAWEHRLKNPGTGAPLYGYKDFPEYVVTPKSLVINKQVEDVFLESYTAQRLMDWIASHGPGERFFAQWWMNEIHSVLPAIEADIGPAGETLHQTVTFEQQAPMARAADGSGDPESPCNVLWRRAIANLEAVDALCAIVDGSLTAEQRANTLWVFCSDNGLHGTDIIPHVDPLFSDPPHSWSVIPPTSDDTVEGTPFHDPNHAKGTLYESGCRIPLIIGGEALPEAVRGTVNDSLIEAVDFYPTLLDIIAPSWRDALARQGVLQHVDGLSFLSTLRGDPAPRTTAFTQVYRPPQVDLGDELWFQRKAVNAQRWSLLWKYSADIGLNPLDGDGDAGGTSGTGGRSGPVEVFELYNLAEDPTETSDLYPTVGGDPVATAMFNELKAHIDARLDL